MQDFEEGTNEHFQACITLQNRIAAEAQRAKNFRLAFKDLLSGSGVSSLYEGYQGVSQEFVELHRRVSEFQKNLIARPGIDLKPHISLLTNQLQGLAGELAGLREILSSLVNERFAKL